MASPYNFAAPLSRDQARREILANVQLKYGPQEKALQEQGRVSNYYQSPGGPIQNWFGQYQQQVAASTAAQKAAFDAAQAQLQQHQQTVAAYDLQQNQGLNAQDQASAQLRGATQSPENAQRAVQSAAARQNLSNTFGGQLTGQQYNNAAYMADKGRIGAGAKLDALLKERQNAGKISSARADLQGQKGQFAVQQTGALRESERKYGLELGAFNTNANRVAANLALGQGRIAATTRGQDIVSRDRQAALDVKRQKLQSDLTNAATQEDYTRARTKVLQYNLAHPHNPISAKGGGGGGIKPPTLQNRQQSTRFYTQGISLASTFKQAPRSKGESDIQFRQAIYNKLTGPKYKIPGALAHAAVEYVFETTARPITKQHVKELYGINVR